MKLWAGDTDNNWYSFLAEGKFDEVNFWQPSTPELRVRVCDQIKDKWFNGKAYYRLHDQPLAVIPKQAIERPDPDYLKWHMQERFVG